MTSLETSMRKLTLLESKIIEFSSTLLQEVAAVKQSVQLLEAGLSLGGTLLEDNLFYLDRLPELEEHLSHLEAVSFDQEFGSRKLALLSGCRRSSASSSRTLVVATDGSVMKKSSRSGGGKAATFSEH